MGVVAGCCFPSEEMTRCPLSRCLSLCQSPQNSSSSTELLPAWEAITEQAPGGREVLMFFALVRFTLMANSTRRRSKPIRWHPFNWRGSSTRWYNQHMCKHSPSAALRHISKLQKKQQKKQQPKDNTFV